MFECDRSREFWSESSYGAICDKLQTLDFNGGLVYAYDNLSCGDVELLVVCLCVVWYLRDKMVLGETNEEFSSIGRLNFAGVESYLMGIRRANKLNNDTLPLELQPQLNGLLCLIRFGN